MPRRKQSGSRSRRSPESADAFIPQDIDAPALHLSIDRYHADELGLSQKEVVSNVITALTSNGMIAPSYWVDPRSGNDYLLTVQYPDKIIKSLTDLKEHSDSRFLRKEPGSVRCRHQSDPSGSAN